VRVFISPILILVGTKHVYSETADHLRCCQLRWTVSDSVW